MTVREAAKLLEVSERTVYALCQSGQLACRRIGTRRGAIRITRDAIDLYMTQASFGAVPAASSASGARAASARMRRAPVESRHVDWSKRRPV